MGVDNMSFDNMLASQENIRNVPNLIRYYLSDEILKALLHLCLRIDIADNNTKAEVVKKILGSDFTEIGTGTNRVAVRHNGFVLKIALDRRGLVDNLQEFKRSMELPKFLAKTYETNYLVNIAEYVEVMEQDKFILNESTIKTVLAALAEDYLFEDIGFTMKNSYNWGAREAVLNDDEKLYYGDAASELYDIVILDYGYLYPLYGQKDKLFRCPKCQHKLRWNSSYTGLQCSNSSCNYQVSPTGLRRRMDLDYEDLENKLANSLNQLIMPNLTKIETSITKIKSDKNK
jgi:hypothetical protein